MSGVFEAVFQLGVPKLLIVVGLLLIVLAIVQKIGAVLSVPARARKIAAATGAILLVGGLVLQFVDFGTDPIPLIAAQPTSGDAPLKVDFDASESKDPDDSIVSYAWDFGDESAPAAGRDAHHTYSSEGTYNVTLTIEDSRRSSYPVVQTIVVYPPESPEAHPISYAPVAIFSPSPMSGQVPLAVVFDASESVDPDGSIVSYNWEFGDGDGDTGVVADHTYRSEGAFQVTLTVVDNDGASDSVSRSIRVLSAEAPDLQMPRPIGLWQVIGQRMSKVILGRNTLENSALIFATDAQSGDVLSNRSIPMLWDRVGGPGMDFVVANTGTLCALNEYGSIWKRVSGDDWDWIRGNTRRITGSPGGLYATDAETGDVYSHNWDTADWTKVGGPGAEFVSGAQGHLYALGVDRRIVFRYDGTPMRWTGIGEGFRALAAGGERLYGVQASTGDIYEFSESRQEWIRIGDPQMQLAADYDGKLYALSEDGTAIYRYDDTPLQWTRILDQSHHLVSGGIDSIAAGGGKLCAIVERSTLLMYDPGL